MVRSKKHLGQHFLQDENIARKILDCLNPDIPCVVEVGPGKGILSKYLLRDPRFDPHFIEIDPEAGAYLEQTYPDIMDRLILTDFLDFDLSSFPKLTLLGNFPYNISSQILFRVIEFRDHIAEVIGMFQKEVALRLAAPPGTRTYGILSVLLGAWYQVEYLFTVPEQVFSPPPKVKSAVIRLRRNDTTHLECDEHLFIQVVKAAFNQRRKILRNALSGFAGKNSLTGYELNRAEQLSVPDFICLTRELEQGII